MNGPALKSSRLDVAIDTVVQRGELADAQRDLHDARSTIVQLQRELEAERAARADAELRCKTLSRRPCIACGFWLQPTK